MPLLLIKSEHGLPDHHQPWDNCIGPYLKACNLARMRYILYGSSTQHSTKPTFQLPSQQVTGKHRAGNLHRHRSSAPGCWRESPPGPLSSNGCNGCCAREEQQHMLRHQPQALGHQAQQSKHCLGCWHSAGRGTGNSGWATVSNTRKKSRNG